MKKDKIKKFDKLLKKYVDKKSFVQIRREFIDEESNVNGFILKASENFLLVQPEEDFRLTGYSIIHKDQFDSITYDKIDKTVKKILKKEGIIDSNQGIKYDINLTSWETIFKNLKKLNFDVIVECENSEEPVFLIGSIKKIGKKSVSVHHYDAAGLLDEKPTKVKYKDITIVKFDDRYANIFKKYLKKLK